MDLETVNKLLSVKAQGDAAALSNYVREDLLADIPLKAEDEKKLDQLVGQLMGL